MDRDVGVLRTVTREYEGFLGVGALVACPGELQVGDELRNLAHPHGRNDSSRGSSTSWRGGLLATRPNPRIQRHAITRAGVG